MSPNDSRTRPAGIRPGSDDDLLAGGIDSESTAPDLDLNAERAAVGGSILSSPARTAVQRIMRNADLTDPVCRVLDLAMRRMVAESVPVDQVTVPAFIEQHGMAHGPHLRFIRSLTHDVVAASPCPVAAPWHAAAVVQTATRREIAEAGRAIERLAELGPLESLREAVATQGRLAMAAIGRAEKAVAA